VGLRRNTLEHFPGNHQLLDFSRAFANFGQLHVAQIAFDGEFAGNPISVQARSTGQQLELLPDRSPEIAPPRSCPSFQKQRP
jgi:hypothetical protein